MGSTTGKDDGCMGQRKYEPFLTKELSQRMEAAGISYEAFYKRKRMGLSLEDCLKPPQRKIDPEKMYLMVYAHGMIYFNKEAQKVFGNNPNIRINAKDKTIKVSTRPLGNLLYLASTGIARIKHMDGYWHPNKNTKLIFKSKRSGVYLFQAEGADGEEIL